MKLPFYTIIGPPLRKNKYFINQVCSSPIVGSISNIYACTLGALGALLSLFDIIMIIKCGQTLPCYLTRHRRKRGNIISPQVERDLKLFSLFVSFEFYIMLFCGAYMQHPVFFLPFLIFYCLIIIGEFVNLLLKLFVDGLRCISKTELFTSMFLGYNWITVFCAFIKLTTTCDL